MIPDRLKKLVMKHLSIVKSSSTSNPGNVEVLDVNLFFKCNALSEIRIVGESQNFRLVDSVLFPRVMRSLILCSTKKGGSYTIPLTVKTLTAVPSANMRN